MDQIMAMGGLFFVTEWPIIWQKGAADVAAVIHMRDYAVHYGFPLHTYIKSLVNPSGLFANKNTFLKFDKGWKHAKTDIEKMPEMIRIEPYVIQMQKCIKELFECCMSMLSLKLVDVIQYANGLIKAAENEMPVFISFESKEKYKAGEYTIHLVDLGMIQSAFKDLQNHPKIAIKDISKHYLETRVEFFYNDKMIMEGTVSFFKKLMINDNKDSTLRLGDRFTLEDFPREGISTVLRVVKMIVLSNQINNKADTIQYYLEPYHKQSGFSKIPT